MVSARLGALAYLAFFLGGRVCFASIGEGGFRVAHLALVDRGGGTARVAP